MWLTRTNIPIRHTYGQANYDRQVTFIDKDWGWVHLDGLYRTTTGGVDWIKMPVPTVATEFSLGQIYPNPTSAKTGSTISFVINGNKLMPVDLELYDVLGKRVSTICSGGFLPGKHELHLNTSGLQPGVYMIRMNAGGRSQTRMAAVQ